MHASSGPSAKAFTGRVYGEGCAVQEESTRRMWRFVVKRVGPALDLPRLDLLRGLAVRSADAAATRCSSRRAFLSVLCGDLAWRR